MVRFVKNEHINKTKWDEALDQSINNYIYAYSYFLDIVADYQWDALILNDYQAIMPLPYRKKYGIKYSYQPVFNQQLGIFYKTNLSNLDIIEFFKAIPKEYKWIDINFNKYLCNRVPEELVDKTNTNYELELINNYEKIQENYSTNLKRNLKKAQSNKLTQIEFVKPEELVELFKTNKGSELKVYQETDYQKLIKLIYLLMHKGKGFVKGVVNEHNTLLASAFFVRSKNKIIFLFSGLSQEGKEKSAMPYLIDQTIKQHIAQKIILDFEGSNNEDLARFYSSFGAKKFTYQRIIINKLPMIIDQARKLLRNAK